MEGLRLVKPSVGLEHEYLDMLDDWKKSGEKLVPWVLLFDTSNFPSMVEMLEGYSKGIGLKNDQVEHSTFWLVNDDKRILGAVNIRHRLNDYLIRIGGHIGYGIRPSDRRKGYATEMLRLALEIVKSMGIEKVLVTCDKDNIGSVKTIIKNGGIFESEDLDEGVLFQRYWINLIKKESKL